MSIILKPTFNNYPNPANNFGNTNIKNNVMNQITGYLSAIDTNTGANLSQNSGGNGYKIVQSGGQVIIDNSYGHTAWLKEQLGHAAPGYVDPKILASSANNSNGYDIEYTLVNKLTGEKTVVKGQYYGGTGYVKSGESGEGRLIIGGLINKNEVSYVARNTLDGKAYIEYTPGLSEPSYYYEPYYPDNSYVPAPSPPVYIPAAPAPPSYETFNLPMPTYKSKIERKSKFIYFFGIDKVNIKSEMREETSISVFGETEIGDAEWITLVTEDFVPSRASIEYYVIDGDNETPILPNEQTIVKEEKLFPNLKTRFTIDELIEIKKEGEVVNISLEDAKNKQDGIYTVTYKTSNANIYYPKTDSVKIKAILRVYDTDLDVPYIESVQLKLYGGEGALWQENS